MPDSKSVLIVDDDRDWAEAIAAFLRGRGLSTSLAHNGIDAKSAIAERKPDLVIMDMMMPRMGGFPVLESLQGRADAPPIIMMTANEGSRHKAVAEHLGVVEYLRKPFDLPALLDAIAKVFPGIDLGPVTATGQSPQSA